MEYIESKMEDIKTDHFSLSSSIGAGSLDIMNNTYYGHNYLSLGYIIILKHIKKIKIYNQVKASFWKLKLKQDIIKIYLWVPFGGGHSTKLEPSFIALVPQKDGISSIWPCHVHEKKEHPTRSVGWNLVVWKQSSQWHIQVLMC